MPTVDDYRIYVDQNLGGHATASKAPSAVVRYLGSRKKGV